MATNSKSEPSKSVSENLQALGQSKDRTSTSSTSSYFVPLDKFGLERKRGRISTSSANLDYLLGGGLEFGEITQFYGGPATGKTHLCHTVGVTLPPSCQAVYIDTERSFREDRMKSIADTRGLDWNNLKHHICVAQPENCYEQEKCLEEAAQLFSKSESSKVKLLILDSLMHHYSKEYPGRSRLPERSQRLNVSMYKLSKMAKTNDMAVLITNQCSAKVQDKIPRPYGGNIVSYASTYIIYLELGNKTIPLSRLTATSIKNPTLSNNFCKLIITNEGFSDEDSPMAHWRALYKFAKGLRAQGEI